MGSSSKVEKAAAPKPSFALAIMPMFMLATAVIVGMGSSSLSFSVTHPETGAMIFESDVFMTDVVAPFVKEHLGHELPKKKGTTSKSASATVSGVSEAEVKERVKSAVDAAVGALEVDAAAMKKENANLAESVKQAQAAAQQSEAMVQQLQGELEAAKAAVPAAAPVEQAAPVEEAPAAAAPVEEAPAAAAPAEVAMPPGMAAAAAYQNLAASPMPNTPEMMIQYAWTWIFIFQKSAPFVANNPELAGYVKMMGDQASSMLGGIDAENYAVFDQNAKQVMNMVAPALGADAVDINTVTKIPPPVNGAFFASYEDMLTW